MLSLVAILGASFGLCCLLTPLAGRLATRWGLLDRPDAQTLVTRSTRGAVRESAILRFLNSLSSRMVGDFSGKSEAEENRFTAELFAALRDDMRALPWTGESAGAEGAKRRRRCERANGSERRPPGETFLKSTFALTRLDAYNRLFG